MRAFRDRGVGHRERFEIARARRCERGQVRCGASGIPAARSLDRRRLRNGRRRVRARGCRAQNARRHTDLRNALLRLVGRGGHFAHRASRGAGVGRDVRGTLRQTRGGGDGVAYEPPRAFARARDVAIRPHARFGQGAHLVGDRDERAGLASATRRLDRGVQKDEIRSFADPVERPRRGFDVRRALAQAGEVGA